MVIIQSGETVCLVLILCSYQSFHHELHFNLLGIYFWLHEYYEKFGMLDIVNSVLLRIKLVG